MFPHGELAGAAGVVIVVGSGEPALGKLRLLRAAGAHVRWFSRDADVAEEMLPLSAEEDHSRLLQTISLPSYGQSNGRRLILTELEWGDLLFAGQRVA